MTEYPKFDGSWLRLLKDRILKIEELKEIIRKLKDELRKLDPPEGSNHVDNNQ